MERRMYLASPYTAPDEAVRVARYGAAYLMAVQLLREGHLFFSSIAHSHSHMPGFRLRLWISVRGMGTPWLSLDGEMPTWKNLYSGRLPMQVSEMSYHISTCGYTHKMFGCRRTGLDFGKPCWKEKTKNANVFWTLAFFFVPKVGVPRGFRIYELSD